ncbi:MAG: phosphatidate cytidylyltransferase [Bullifex sp.]
MTSNTKRIITAVIAVPLLASIILFLPQYNYLAFALLVLTVSILGSYELHAMLSRHTPGRLLLPPFIGSVQIILTYIQYAFFPQYSLTLYSLIGLIMVAMALEIKKGEVDNFKGSIERLAYTVLQIIYPNTFAIFFIKFCFMEDAWLYLLIFFALVFSSDTFAYCFGILFGKNNKGIVKVSPNKSVAGFIAALHCPAIIGCLCGFFIDGFEVDGLLGFFLGLCTAAAAAIGDLVESILKRSAGMKDSGKIIPGRGGMLDSIDSLLFAAPVFMCFMHFMQYVP